MILKFHFKITQRAALKSRIATKLSSQLKLPPSQLRLCQGKVFVMAESSRGQSPLRCDKKSNRDKNQIVAAQNAMLLNFIAIIHRGDFEI
jgi:hypothetical protein